MTVPPRHAFTQGTGLVFQIVGGTLFLLSATLCCGSSLLSKQFAQRHDWTTFGWHFAGDEAGKPSYSAQRALSVSLFAAIGLGLGLAGTGLGMQATRRHAPAGAFAVSLIGAAFWLVHTLFAIQYLRSFLFVALPALLSVVFLCMLVLSVGAWRELRRDPPPPGHEVLPPEYKVPYSHYHEDPPDVRLANEIEARRQRLEVQRKELETLEERARKAREEREAGDH